MNTIEGLTDNEIAEKYKGLVYKLSRKVYATKKDIIDANIITLEDIVQVGYIGLYNAIKTYNSEKNCTFMTYAWRCVSNSISRDIFRPKVINSYMKFGNFSLDSTIGDDGESSLMELTGEIDSDIDGYANRELQIKLFNRLTEKEREMLILYNIEGWTLEEIGARHNVSRTRARDMLNEVIGRLKIQYMREVKKNGDN